MTDRLAQIREAAARVTRHDKATEGRWMRLESITRSGMDAQGRGGHGHRRRFRARSAKRSTWVVCIKGVPKIGQQIRIRKTGGTAIERYVERVIVHATERADGCSIVYVSKSPVMPPASTQPPMESVPAPKPPPMLKQRNPRICEECDGPCRPGAGVCDKCKRGARIASDW